MALGPDIVPEILERMTRRRGHWDQALRELTGESPEIAPTATLEQIQEAWVAWGRRKGLLR